MAESPSGYLPDITLGSVSVFGAQFDIRMVSSHKTEIMIARSGREQRRGVYPTAGYRSWICTSFPRDFATRKVFWDFFQSKRGRLFSFYAWRPDPADYGPVFLPSVSGATTVLSNYKNGTYAGISVGGVADPGATVTLAIGPNGEDRINFSGVKTGTVSANVTNARLLIVCRFDMDDLDESFLEAASVYAVPRIAIREVV